MSERRGVRRPTYLMAVRWVASNDNAGDNEPPEELEGYLTVLLVADLWGKPARAVADDVYGMRQLDRAKGGMR